MTERKVAVTPREYVDALNSLIERLDTIIETKKRRALPGVKEFRSIRKEVLSIKKNFPKIKWRRPTPQRTAVYSSFKVPKTPSKSLATFLSLKENEKITHLDVMTALRVYIFLKPDETRESFLKWKHLNPNGRDLRNPNKLNEIIPDDPLKTLLNYDSYKQKVEQGMVFSMRKDKETGMKQSVQVTDTALKFCVIVKLLSLHLDSSQ